MTMTEIEARKSEIAQEIPEATEERLAELETEVASLEAEERTICEAKEARKAEETAVIEAVATEEVTLPENNNSEVRTTMEINSMEYRNAFLKTLMGQKLGEEEARAYASSDNNTAIPTLTADVFFEKMKALAPMLSEITLLQAAGNIKFIAEGTRNAAAKHTENAAVSAASDTIVTVTLGAYEFMKVIGISKTASAMSVDAFEGWLADMLAGDIARKIDDYIINDSTNGISAITYTTNTNQILQTATAGYGYEDLCDLVALLPAAYDSEAKFLVNKATLWKLRKIVDTTKRPIFDPTEKTLLGYPVLVDDYVTKTGDCVFFGRWKDVVGNLSQPIQVESDISSGFLSGTINYRGFAAFDSKPVKTDAIVRLVTTC